MILSVSSLLRFHYEAGYSYSDDISSLSPVHCLVEFGRIGLLTIIIVKTDCLSVYIQCNFRISVNSSSRKTTLNSYSEFFQLTQIEATIRFRFHQRCQGFQMGR